MGKLFRILSIDGGGIRGVIPATVLAEIENRTGQRIADLFDLISGTSTGGILALGAVKPDGQGRPEYRAADLLDLYFSEGTTIFPQSIWREISTGKYTLDEKYPASGVESVLQKYFGEARLKDAVARVVITSYEIELRQPWFFRSERAQADPAYDFLMWQAARATSAAPTYFEPARLDRADSRAYWALIDGGTYANNPAMCAYADAKNAAPECDVLMVSLGTGEHTRPIHYQQAKHWGLLGWAKPILDVVFDGASKATEYQLQQLLPARGGVRRYYRFQTALTLASDDMDNTDVENLADLRKQAEGLIEARSLDLSELCAQLMAGRGASASS